MKFLFLLLQLLQLLKNLKLKIQHEGLFGFNQQGIRIDLMSLYNGFATRQTQQKYLVMVLEKRLLRFYQGQACNQQKFFSVLNKLRSKISRLENNKYHQPKFADSLAMFLSQVMSQDKYNLTKLDSYQSKSMISNNDNQSQISMNFSFDRLPNMSKFHSLPRENDSVIRAHRNNYRSFQSVKTTPVITQSQQEQNNVRHRSSRLRTNQLSHLRLRLQPPKLDTYIDKIKKQTRALEMMSRRSKKQQTGEVGQAYLGQRRKKNKKTIRTYQIQ